MDAPTSIQTCQDVCNLISENSVKASEKLKGTHNELNFALKCIQNVDKGLGHLPVDEEQVRLLCQRIHSVRFIGCRTHFHFSAKESFESSTDSTDSTELTDSSDEENELSKGLHEEINAVVQHFLFPYISNQITPEQDAKRTIPFFTTLSEQLCERHKIDKNNEKFQSVASYYYIKHAIEGLYTNGHLEAKRNLPIDHTKDPSPPTTFKVYYESLTFNERIHLLQDLEYEKLSKWYQGWIKTQNLLTMSFQFNKPVLILFHALFPALKKDFPHLIFLPEEIIKLTLDIIKKVEKKRNANHTQRLQEIKATYRSRYICPPGVIPRAELLLRLKKTVKKKDS